MSTLLKENQALRNKGLIQAEPDPNSHRKWNQDSFPQTESLFSMFLGISCSITGIS